MEQVLSTFHLTMTDVMMIGVGVVLFTIFLIALSRVLFRPYVTLVEAREAATTGAVEQAAHLTDRAATLEQQYEERIHSVRVSAVSKKLAALQAARAEAQRIIGAAEEQAQAEVARGRAELESHLGKLRSELEREREQLAREIVRRVTSTPQKSEASHV